MRFRKARKEGTKVEEGGGARNGKNTNQIGEPRLLMEFLNQIKT